MARTGNKKGNNHGEAYMIRPPKHLTQGLETKALVYSLIYSQFTLTLLKLCPLVIHLYVLSPRDITSSVFVNIDWLSRVS